MDVNAPLLIFIESTSEDHLAAQPICALDLSASF